MGQLVQHLHRLEDVVRRRALAHGHGVSLACEDHGGALTAGLVGGGTERVPRNRGPSAFVVPMCEIGGDQLRGWVGLWTEWRRTSENGVGRNDDLVFHAVSMTVHVGYPYFLPKPQMFRVEWSVEPADAGQPHWQFDALESLTASQGDDIGVFRDLLQSEVEAGDSSWLDAEDIVGVTRGIPFSRMHFASAAAWWQQDASHTHVPASTIEVESWVDRALKYTISELVRLRR